MIQAKEKSILVKEIAQAHGFDQCGIAKAVPLDDDARRLERWLQKGYHGEMHYMENHFDLRVDPTKLVPGAKTVITVLYNYFPEETQQIGIPKIAKYAYGEDYHLVIRKKLQLFLQSVREKMGHVEGRGFVDSAPVLERSWAQRSGLGWIGKNGNLINKKMGSFFFIATLITDLELEPDVPHATDHCGTCSRCVDACPTDAILIDKTVDASKCISYFTIELKSKDLPEDLKSKSENWIFGCDICQDVCPWNRFSKPHQHQELEPFKEIMQFNIEDWLDINEESFKKIFKHSPLKRSGFEGIKRNLRLYQG
ncbi:MAG: tRNA epoxyqueuosine(34) reductase QueG [Bacteroidota bacterium]|jgi:epoxyqueuosine reductase